VKTLQLQVYESSKTAVTAQSITLAADQVASSVVAEALELVTDTEADHMPELADSDRVNISVIFVFQLCTKIILNKKREISYNFCKYS